jgi:hypothetical protein
LIDKRARRKLQLVNSTMPARLGSKSNLQPQGQRMKNNVVRTMVLSAPALLAITLTGGGVSAALAQGWDDRGDWSGSTSRKAANRQ